MKQTTIAFKATNILIEELKKQKNVKILKEKGFFASLFSKKEFADIYFHSGSLNEKSIENIKNSKLTIVNSFSLKNEIIKELKTSNEKIEVIYPSINIQKQDAQELKKNFCEKHSLNIETKIIFFTAKNFKTSGIKEVFDICSTLGYDDFKIVIAGEKNQVFTTNFLLPKYQSLQNKIILLEDNKNIDELFYISDIFLLPTYNKNFSSNVLKAMFCKCAVFLTMNNHAKEIMDVFSTMNSPSDSSTTFKIDALFLDDDELEKIKNDNHKKAIESTLEANLEKINYLIENV